jgi:hypothetical protein
MNKRKQDFGAWKRIKSKKYPRGRGPNTMIAVKRFGYPNIKRLKELGEGSDRKVYQLDKDKVLKIATTIRGLRQNIYEKELAKSGGDLKHYETGKNYVVMEKAEPAGENVMKLMKELDEAQKRDQYIKLIGLTENQQKLLIDKGYPDKPYISDVLEAKNWGEKKGKPVIVDAGVAANEVIFFFDNTPAGFKSIIKTFKKKPEDSDEIIKEKNMIKNVARGTLKKWKEIQKEEFETRAKARKQELSENDNKTPSEEYAEVEREVEREED